MSQFDWLSIPNGDSRAILRAVSARLGFNPCFAEILKESATERVLELRDDEGRLLHVEASFSVAEGWRTHYVYVMGPLEREEPRPRTSQEVLDDILSWERVERDAWR